MKMKIVADSASNVYETNLVDYAAVPLKILAEKEYIDVKGLDVLQMAHEIRAHKGKSSTSCPNAAEWLEAFGDAEIVFGVTITSKLSGSYNSAMMAAQEYMENYPDRQVYIIDSLSTGPHMKMIIDKLSELMSEFDTFEDIKTKIDEYVKHTHLLFSLESVTNLARNGRVNPAIAMAVNALGIRIVGEAYEGQLAQRNKCRGEKKAIQILFENMKQLGFQGGKVSIGHCYNEQGAQAIKKIILSEFPNCVIDIHLNHALNCFYAELGGLLVAFEDQQ